MEMEILLVEKMKKLFFKKKKHVMPMCVRHLETFSSRIGAAIPTPVLKKEGQSCIPKQTTRIF